LPAKVELVFLHVTVRRGHQANQNECRDALLNAGEHGSRDAAIAVPRIDNPIRIYVFAREQKIENAALGDYDFHPVVLRGFEFHRANVTVFAFT
jgi:hypothetical protein